MTPARTGGSRGGAFEIDRWISQLGPTPKEQRIRQSSHTTSIKKYNRINAVIDKLIENDQWEILRAFRDKKVSVGQLIEADRKDKTRSTLDSLQLRVRLWDREVEDESGRRHIEKGALHETLLRMKCGPETKKRYRDSFRALQTKAAAYLGPRARVADLADVPWIEVAESWGGSGADWMLMRRALSRFLSTYLKSRWHPFRHQVLAEFPSKHVNKRRPKISIERFLKILEKAPEHAQAGYWFLAITGVRGEEYRDTRPEHLHRDSYSYEPPGTKTEGSDGWLKVDPRWWPYLERAVPARLGYNWMHIYWQRACLAAGEAKLVPDERGTRSWQIYLHPELAPHRRKPKGVPREVHEKAEAAKAAKLARLPKLRYVGATMHDLRHCHGQWAMKDGGAQESEVQASLRHASPGMTRDYVMYEASGEVSSALANAFFGKKNGKENGKKKRGRRA